MSAAQFGKISTAQIDKITTQHLAIASRFTTKPNGKSSRKKRGTLHYLGQFPKARRLLVEHVQDLGRGKCPVLESLPEVNLRLF
jgi:hypothetical protein